MTKTKRFLLAALFLTLLVPTSASAAFICSAALVPAAGSPGNPSVRVTTSTTASCGGTVLTYWFCPASGTATTCAANYRFTAAEMIGIHDQAVRAADTQQIANMNTSNCTGGGTGCAMFIEYKY